MCPHIHTAVYHYRYCKTKRGLKPNYDAVRVSLQQCVRAIARLSLCFINTTTVLYFYYNIVKLQCYIMLFEETISCLS